MVSRSCTTLAILMVAGSTALADFPAQITSTIGSKQETMVLTGTAVRKKYFFSIYKIASYVKKGERFRSPEELAARDCPKQLHLVHASFGLGQPNGQRIQRSDLPQLPEHRVPARGCRS
ncbi:MAG: hypothetical protein KatS3mg105_2989 [Gemmatales bacterium]|nr:MAG: hypothetical protein KatS3mg105_2989 [Gemmatales bacterium]